MSTTNVPPDRSFSKRPEDTRERYFAKVLVIASRVLTPIQKLLLCRLIDLNRPKGNRPGGCFASAETLGAMLGMSVRTVKRGRAQLRRLGLLQHGRDQKGRDRFYAVLPANVSLTPPPGTRGDDMTAWIGRRVTLLDGHIGELAELNETESDLPFGDAKPRQKPRLIA